MFTNMRFLMPLIVNQLAGLLFNMLVAYSDLGIASPFTNCITFIVTYLSQKYFAGESIFSEWRFFAGTVLIAAGMYFCITKYQ